MRRKGELTSSQIDSSWPHQVALTATSVMGANYPVIAAFCDDHDLAVCVRRQRFRRHDQEFIVYCFSRHADAVCFRERFGGEAVDAQDPRAWRRQQEQRS